MAVRGRGSDGHDFIDKAVAAGAAAVIVDRDVPIPPGPVRLRVEDTREALAHLAAAWFGLRGEPSGRAPLSLVGVTGTNGKTTVAWWLRSILAADGRRPALIGTIEYDLLADKTSAPLTTPGSLELSGHLATARDAGASDAIVEVSSHALQQRRCDGLTFAAAVFTNLSGDHLDYHGTMERYADAKRRLFTLLAPDAPAIVNLDDALGAALARELPGKVISYALEAPGADATARIMKMDLRGTEVSLACGSFSVRVTLALLGRHNVENALAAAVTAEALGVDRASIRAGLEGLRYVPGRLERVEPEGCAFTVLVDYAHTDAALASALAALRPLTPGRLICVFGCGGDRDRSKRPRMGSAVAGSADVAYVTSDNPRGESPQRIIDDILPGFPPAGRCRVNVCVDRRRAIQTAIEGARPGDTVLIAGKGHEEYQQVGDRVLPFSDAEIARACLKKSDVMEEVA